MKFSFGEIVCKMKSAVLLWIGFLFVPDSISVEEELWNANFDKAKVIHHKTKVCVYLKGQERCVSKEKAPGDTDEIVKMFSLANSIVDIDGTQNNDEKKEDPPKDKNGSDESDLPSAPLTAAKTNTDKESEETGNTDQNGENSESEENKESPETVEEDHETAAKPDITDKEHTAEEPIKKVERPPKFDKPVSPHTTKEPDSGKSESESNSDGVVEAANVVVHFKTANQNQLNIKDKPGKVEPGERDKSGEIDEPDKEDKQSSASASEEGTETGTESSKYVLRTRMRPYVGRESEPGKKKLKFKKLKTLSG